MSSIGHSNHKLEELTKEQTYAIKDDVERLITTIDNNSRMTTFQNFIMLLLTIVIIGLMVVTLITQSNPT